MCFPPWWHQHEYLLGCRVQGVGFGFRVQGFGSRVQGVRFGCRVGCRVQGFGSRVQGVGFGFRVQGFRSRVKVQVLVRGFVQDVVGEREEARESEGEGDGDGKGEGEGETEKEREREREKEWRREGGKRDDHSPSEVENHCAPKP